MNDWFQSSAVVKAGSLSRCDGLMGQIDRAEPSIKLLVTTVTS